ncbi:hypothetical protein PVAP13_4NG211644 [Panicum virgatum]|uniref:Uncharacterized protein n=1 Tax=Panicum virgatum TaxID=38727 RepID=A0A8T0TBM7_PANVG|nr:hypothetical protein PVAP13_4NG211644 [Panicum virgatum]
MSSTWRSYGFFRRPRRHYEDNDGFASRLPPSICSGSASGFHAAALLARLDLVVVEHIKRWRYAPVCVLTASGVSAVWFLGWPQLSAGDMVRGGKKARWRGGGRELRGAGRRGEEEARRRAGGRGCHGAEPCGLQRGQLVREAAAAAPGRRRG